MGSEEAQKNEKFLLLQKTLSHQLLSIKESNEHLLAENEEIEQQIRDLQCTADDDNSSHQHYPDIIHKISDLQAALQQELDSHAKLEETRKILSEKLQTHQQHTKLGFSTVQRDQSINNGKFLLEQEMEQSENLLSRTIEINQNLQIECEMLQSKLQPLEDNRKQLNSEISNLKNFTGGEEASDEPKNDSLDDNEDQIQELQQMVQDTKVQCANEFNLAKEQLNELQKESDTVKMNIKNMRETLKRNEPGTVQLSIENLRRELKETRAKHHTDMSTMKKEIETLKAENKKLFPICLQLEMQEKNSERDLSKLRELDSKIVHYTMNQEKEIESTLAQLEKLRSESTALKQKREQLEQRIQLSTLPPCDINHELHNTLDSKLQELAELKKKYPRRMEQLRQCVRHETDTMEEEEQQCKKLVEELAIVEAELLRKDIEATTEEIAEVSEQIRTMRRGIEQREKQHKDILERKKSITAQNERAKVLHRKHKKQQRKQARRQKAIAEALIVNAVELAEPDNSPYANRESCIDLPPIIEYDNDAEEPELRSSTGESWTTVENSHSVQKKNIAATESLQITTSRFSSLPVQQPLSDSSSADEAEKRIVSLRRTANTKKPGRKRRPQSVQKPKQAKNENSVFLFAVGTLLIIVLFLLWRIIS
uniref:Uncharacterized protein n=1 Tax=Vannella robusta TaxID=1487602 RepID=A0A7S4HQI0_9EUKA|mmetsp:Transcript_14232/g.18024  ORF Transcript_14232/g.18024 Transcript_14232/m.18024 type:complete len:654 (+) Transcript_14232:36-1997(+)